MNMDRQLERSKLNWTILWLAMTVFMIMPYRSQIGEPLDATTFYMLVMSPIIAMLIAMLGHLLTMKVIRKDSLAKDKHIDDPTLAFAGYLFDRKE